MSGWQKIETAPTDEREMLLLEGSRVFIGYSMLGAWRDNADCSECVRDQFHQPTHWMLLPEPPKPD